MFGDDALLQVYPGGIRHIRSDKRIQEWQPPGGKQIQMVAVNERQIVAVLDRDNDLIYFELDASGAVVEIEKTQVQKEVVAIGIAPIPVGRQRARYLAVADADNKTKIYSLAPNDCLQNLAVQIMPSRVSSIKILEMTSLAGTVTFVNSFD